MNHLKEPQNHISEKMPQKNTYRTNNRNIKIFKHAHISKIYIKEICAHVIRVKDMHEKNKWKKCVINVSWRK